MIHFFFNSCNFKIFVSPCRIHFFVCVVSYFLQYFNYFSVSYQIRIRVVILYSKLPNLTFFHVYLVFPMRPDLQIYSNTLKSYPSTFFPWNMIIGSYNNIFLSLNLFFICQMFILDFFLIHFLLALPF